MDIVHQKPNYALPATQGAPLRTAGRGDDDADELANQIRNTVAQVLGPDINMQQVMPMQMQTSGDFFRRGTRPRNTTGLPVAISGTATVVQLDVASALTGFSDPIRSILGLGVHEDQRIIIKRAYVSGGGASIVPERAPARTVSLAEDVREVVLTRYGADVEWNLNLLSRPKDFAREMDLKLSAQRLSLQCELTKLGYDMLMTEGTSLIAALVASNSLNTRNPRAAVAAAERIYVTSVFGAMQRFPYPVHNLLSAAKFCTNYSIATAEATTMIIPHGLAEMHRYTKPENMLSYVHGTTHGDPIATMVTGGSKDVGNGTTIFVHVPPQNNELGAANPVTEESMLASEVTIVTYYTPTPADADNKDDMVYDPVKRKLTYKRQLEANEICVRVYRLQMMSAILAVPNGASQQTGELLVGYPATFVGTDVSTETGRLRLRTYLGSVLYKPENVIILPDVSFGGIIDFSEYVIGVGDLEVHDGDRVVGGPAFFNTCGRFGPTDDVNTHTQLTDLVNDAIERDGRGNSNVSACSFYQAATFNSADRKLNRENTGHLGNVDSPSRGDMMYGNFVYNAEPNPAGGGAAQPY